MLFGKSGPDFFVHQRVSRLGIVSSIMIVTLIYAYTHTTNTHTYVHACIHTQRHYYLLPQAEGAHVVCVQGRSLVVSSLPGNPPWPCTLQLIAGMRVGLAQPRPRIIMDTAPAATCMC